MITRVTRHRIDGKLVNVCEVHSNDEWYSYLDNKGIDLGRWEALVHGLHNGYCDVCEANTDWYGRKIA